MTPKHPRQPVELARGGARFKGNPIVRYLLDTHPEMTLDRLETLPGCTDDDHSQFAQLLGRSLSAYSELGCCNDGHLDAAERVAEGMRDRRDSGDVLQDGS